MSKTLTKRKHRTNKPLIQRAFMDWMIGSSLRDLQDKYGFHHNTFWYQFKKHYGDNFSSIPRGNHGTYSILKEYLGSRNLTSKQKREVSSFIHANKEMLIEIDIANGENKLYTARQIRSKTLAECGRKDDAYDDCLFESKIIGEVEDMYDTIDEYDDDYDFYEDGEIEVLHLRQNN